MVATPEQAENLLARLYEAQTSDEVLDLISARQWSAFNFERCADTHPGQAGLGVAYEISRSASQ